MCPPAVLLPRPSTHILLLLLLRRPMHHRFPSLLCSTPMHHCFVVSVCLYCRVSLRMCAILAEPLAQLDADLLSGWHCFVASGCIKIYFFVWAFSFCAFTTATKNAIFARRLREDVQSLASWVGSGGFSSEVRMGVKTRIFAWDV